MPETTDMDLVRDFVRDHSEAAFAELVQRRLNLVYSVALRYTGQDGDARDIAQAVFIVLAQKARSLPDRTVLTGWLYETTRFTAMHWIRSNARRHAREQEAYMQSLNPDSAADWQQLVPHLESAMSQLAERDRTLLALRFYENRTAAESAMLLGIREDAAHKRTARALEKIRKFLGKRGITLSAAAIAAAISGNAVQSAPVGLAAVITAAAFSGTVVTTSALAAATKAIAMTTLQKSIVTAALVVTVGAGVFEAHQASRLNAENQELLQGQSPLAAQVQELQRERDDATNQVASLKEELAKSRDNSRELLELRGMAGVARRATEDAERLRRQLAQQQQQQQAASNDSPIASAMADSMKMAMEQQVQAHLSRLDASLHLTPDQMLSASNILMRQADLMAVSMQQGMSGKFDKDQIARLAKASGDPDTQIKALLTPDQLAVYPAYQQTEAAHTASLAANTELLQLQSTLGLTPDQLDPVYAALYNVGFNQLTGNAKPPASATGVGDAMQWTLDQKVAALEPLLTPAQLEIYRQQQAAQSKLMKDIAKKMLGSGEGQ